MKSYKFSVCVCVSRAQCDVVKILSANQTRHVYRIASKEYLHIFPVFIFSCPYIFQKMKNVWYVQKKKMEAFLKKNKFVFFVTLAF